MASVRAAMQRDAEARVRNRLSAMQTLRARNDAAQQYMLAQATSRAAVPPSFTAHLASVVQMRAAAARVVPQVSRPRRNATHR